MPLFQASGGGGGAKAQPGQSRTKTMKFRGSSERRTDDDGSVFSLTRLCLLSLADNMKEVWAKDYADNYMDHYSFRYIMGPFNLLPGDLVEELMSLLCSRKQLSRAALHLLLVPQLRVLSLEKCPGLVNSALCPHIAARCQGLWSLDLSGAQQLPSKVLSETLSHLPALRSLSLAGTTTDRCVIRTISSRCRLLRHLDVSRCHFLPPAALLLLAGGASFSSSGSPSGSSSTSHLSPLPLSSLLALDIGFGEQEGDPVAAAAYLLLSLPCLERVAVEGLTQACCLIQNREFDQTHEFTDREGVSRLEEVWEEWRQMQMINSCREKGEEAEEEDEEEEEDYGCESKEDASRGDGWSCSENQSEERRRASQSGEERLILRLKDIQGLACDCLDSLSHLCPNIHAISVNLDDDDVLRRRNQGSLLASSLQTWSGQLRSLSLHYSGPLVDLIPALKVAGLSLLSLTLEGLKTSPHSPLLEVITACPRLRELLISAEPPATPQEEEDEEDQWNDRDFPRLPDLKSLTLRFSYEHSQMKPVMSWMSLKWVLRCLLAGSSLLEKLSLVSLPCPLNCVLQNVLNRYFHQHRPGPFVDMSLLPLARTRHIEIPRTDVTATTVRQLVGQSKRLEYIDVNCCWHITQSAWFKFKTFRKIEVVWS